MGQYIVYFLFLIILLLHIIKIKYLQEDNKRLWMICKNLDKLVRTRKREVMDNAKKIKELEDNQNKLLDIIEELRKMVSMR